VTDTPPDIERTYREMLLDRSRGDRLKMGCSMFATARAFVVASELRKNPTVTPGALRRALFLRLYGDEFDETGRASIAARLEADAPESSRSPLRVAVDWDMLEVALTSNSDEMRSYLDVRTGEVPLLPIDHIDEELSEDDIETDLAAGHLVPIEPLGSDVEFGWMVEFTASETNRELQARLDAALGGRRPFRRFKDVLNGAGRARENWFAFRDGRVRRCAQEWLAEHDIEPTTVPPPVRPPGGQ
jgi:hypothetical protein